MVSIIWRVKSSKFDTKDFIKRFELEPDAIFEEGFNLCFFDEPSKDQFIEDLRDFIDDYQDVFEELLQMGVNSQIDMGVTVGTEDQYTCSLVLPSEILTKLSMYNIDIAFSAYPASE